MNNRIPKLPKPQEHIKVHPETFDQILTKITTNMKTRQKDGKQYFVGTTIKRRHQALRNTEDLINAKRDLSSISECYVTTSEMWAMMNLCIFGNVDYIEKERHLSAGAAIWILDHADEKINIPFNYTDLPDMFDPVHDPDVIRSATYLIQHRNEEKFKPLYQRFISQIPEETITTALAHFEESFWAWIDRVFDFISPLAERIGILIRQYNRAADEFNEGLKELQKSVPEQKKFNPLLANPVPVFQVPPLPGITGMNSYKIDNSISMLHKMEQLTDLMMTSQQEIERIHQLLYTAIVLPIDLSLIHKDIYEKTNNKKILPEDFPTFYPGDPYELCFAFFHLQDQDSELCWLWGACMGLMNQVGKNLPWGLSDYQNYQLGSSNKPVHMPDLHRMQYYTDAQDYPVSLSQLVYNLGGGLLPRKWELYAGWSDYLRDIGVKDIKMAVAAISIFHSIRQKRTPSLYDDPIEPSFTSEDVEELQEEIKALQSKLKHVTGEAREQERKAQKLERLLEEEKAKYHSDQEELASLREVLFTSEQEETGTTLSLPYTVKKRIVVYGGHDTWLKAIKDYVKGDIRFIDKDQGILDRSLIRNADVIWIQHNALSHRQYYAIIDEVRKWDKPVRYFLYASAKKCVEQIALDDQKVDH